MQLLIASEQFCGLGQKCLNCALSACLFTNILYACRKVAAFEQRPEIGALESQTILYISEKER